jgi:hypothetical protein
MRRIPEQCGPEPVSPIVGTSRLKAGGFFVATGLGRFFAAAGANRGKQQPSRYVQQTRQVYGAPHHRLITLFYNGPVKG